MDYFPFFKDVFFYAVIALIGVVIEFAVFMRRRKYKRWVYFMGGILGLSFFEIPRIIIVFLPQPEIGLSPNLAKILGGGTFILGLVIVIVAFCQIMQAKKEKWKLRTTKLYKIVRHPMYLGDILWALGLSIYLNALYAFLLTPFWLLARYTLAVLEEDKLLDKYGEVYENYMKNTPKRIIPYLF